MATAKKKAPVKKATNRRTAAKSAPAAPAEIHLGGTLYKKSST